jgi:type IX secretion system PorP/SprF family membrane protein
MNLLRHLLIVLLCAVIGISSSKGQDVHFSQFNNAPLYLNPANAGLFNGKYRIALNFRNQWRAVTTPFKTYAASFDLPLVRRLFGKDMIGAGFLFMRDKAGDSDYGLTQANLSVTYMKALNYRGTNYLSIGFMAGTAQRTIDYSKLYYDNQFDGESYNPLINNGETFNTTRFSFADISTGLQWLMQEKSGITYTAGLGLFHLNKPNQSLFKDQNIPLEQRLSLNANVSVPVDNHWTAVPAVYFSSQKQFRELVIGGTARYNRNMTDPYSPTLIGGLFTRWGDALIFSAGAEYRQICGTISYDVNYSRLRAASDYRGGLEIGIIAHLFGSVTKLRREITCPIF